MHPIKKLFVAIDFSPASDEALRRAHQRASRTHAKLAVCHIIPNELRSNLLFPQLSRDAAMKVPAEVEGIAQAVSNRVKQVTGRTGEDVTIIVDHGTPYVEILKAAEKFNAGLIVIGSHGMTSASSVLLGSVTHKIIRYAHCTVLVARPAKNGGGIVAGTDFSDPALPAIEAAADEAIKTKKPLIIVHSIDLPFATATHGAMAFGGPVPTISDQDYEVMREDARGRLLDALKKFNAEGEAVLTSGPAGSALVSIAKDRNADLLVVGTQGLTGLSRVLLGSVAESVASHAPCSVLITRLH